MTLTLSVLILHGIASLLYGVAPFVLLVLLLTPWLLLVSVPICALWTGRELLSQWRCRPWQYRAEVSLLLALVLGLGGFYLLSPGIRPLAIPYVLVDAGRRLKVESASDTDTVHAWAVDLLRKPERELPLKRDYTGRNVLHKSALPASVRDLAMYAYVVDDKPGSRHLRIASNHGRAAETGIMLGSPGFRPQRSSWWLHRWRDGVYGYGRWPQ